MATFKRGLCNEANSRCKIRKHTAAQRRKEVCMNKYLGPVCALILFQLYTLAAALGGIWVYRYFTERPFLLSPPAVVQPAAVRLAEEAKPVREEAKPELPVQKKVDPAQPAPQNEPNENGRQPDVQTPPAPAVYVWDPKTVMTASRAGRKLGKYAADYAAVMSANVKELNAAIVAKDPGLNVAEARRLIAAAQERRAAITGETRAFLRELVVRAANSSDELKGAVLVERGSVTCGEAAADATARLTEALDAVTVNLPPLPERFVRKKAEPAKNDTKRAGPPAKSAKR